MHDILETIRIGSGVELARVVRAGRWIFAQGNMATMHAGGICVGSGHPGGDPLLREPAGLSQGKWILQALAENLEKAGASLDDLVRVDQYYDSVASVHPYHLARRAAFHSMIPPSTSIIVEGLLTPGATLCLEALAVIDGRNTREAVAVSGVPMPRASSGFAPIMKVDEFIFLSGQVADSADGSGIAAEATMNPEFVWDGSEIARQTHYVLGNLIRAAEAAGSDREHIVKAQVYLRSMEDLPEFNEAWKQNFGELGPARTVAPASALALRKGIVEINMVCMTRGTPIDRYGASDDRVGVPAAVTSAGMTHLSAVSAMRDDRLAAQASAARQDRYVRSVAASETEAIIDEVESRLARLGNTLQDITRIIQFHTDLRDFLPSVEVWQRRLGRPVPISAMQVQGPLVPSGAQILADCWAVAQ
jgi:enamine deaminase RidA (YjgF/YER057c/UK114 family)